MPHQHPMDVQTVQDRFPFDLHKAINHVIDNGNRFKLVKDVEALNFFSAGASDPADTTTGGVWIQASNGSAYPADNSGIFITIGGAADYRNPAGNVISTVFRQRYAIAPVWHEFTYANVQLNNFKNSVRALLKGIVSGSVSATDIDHIL